MNDLCVYTLFSGSAGNCTYISYGETRILIDAGRNAKTINTALESLGTSLTEINAIFITHEHGDHVSGLDVIMHRTGIPVHMTAPSADAFLSHVRPGRKSSVVIHQPEYSVTVGELRVSSFAVPHDSVFCVGYTVCAGKTSVGVVTDIGKVTPNAIKHLRGCDGAIIEANHDVGMLRRGSYAPSLKRRILSDNGHLSNEACSALIADLAAERTKNILLAHISDENNTPDLALKTVRLYLEKNNIALPCISTADKITPTRLL